MNLIDKANLLSGINVNPDIKEIIRLYNAIIKSLNIYNAEENGDFSSEQYFSIFRNDLLDYTLLIYRILAKFKDDKQYLVNSLAYYNSELRTSLFEQINNSRSSRSSLINHYDFMYNLLRLSIASYNNLINSWYEKMESLKAKHPLNYIALFESSPIDQDILDFNTEIQTIEDTVFEHSTANSYFPIVRFATNRRIFKEIIKDIKPDIYHFTGHGDQEALVFTFPNGKSDYFKVDQFISYLESFSSSYLIKLIYLNSCESSDYVRKLKTRRSIHFKVLKTIGYIGGNDNSRATEFSTSYYDSLFKSSKIEICNSYQKTKKDYLKLDPFNERKQYLNRLVFTKR